MLTVITMYRGVDAEFLVQVVEGSLTEEQRRAWRDAHDCDLPGDEDKDDDVNNMFFREFDVPVPNNATADLFNVNQQPERIMLIEGFVICGDKGQPVAVEGLPEDATNVEYATDNYPIFKRLEDAWSVLNSFPGTSSFEGFENGTVRKVTLSVGDVVAEQDSDTDEED